MSGAIHQDAQVIETSISEDDAAEELLRRWTQDAQNEPSEGEEEDTSREEDTNETEETDDDSEHEAPEDDEDSEGSEDEAEDDEGQDDDDESETEEDSEKPKVLKDSDIVKVTVDGKEIDVPVEKLKRLYGQEAALTRKSQEAAALRKKAEDQGARAVATAEKMLQRALERYKPYQDIDWLVAAKTLDTDELQALRSEAEKAYADVQFISQELDTFMAEVAKARKDELMTEARATFKALTDPKTGIPGFNEALYNDMRLFAINSGVPEEIVNQIVSEPIIRLIHKAYLHDKGQKALTKTNPVTKKNKKIIKSKVSSEVTRTITKTAPQKQAQERLKRTGSIEDAAELMLARWREAD